MRYVERIQWIYLMCYKLIPSSHVHHATVMRLKRPFHAIWCDAEGHYGKAHGYIKCKGSIDHLSWNNAGTKRSIRFMLAKPSPPIDTDILWQMESSLSFLDGSIHTTSHNVQAGVIGQFKIVNTSHNAGQIVVRCVRGFTWFANYSEHWCESLETYLWISKSCYEREKSTYLQ